MASEKCAFTKVFILLGCFMGSKKNKCFHGTWEKHSEHIFYTKMHSNFVKYATRFFLRVKNAFCEKISSNSPYKLKYEPTT